MSFQATKDEDHCSNFQRKCDGKIHHLIFIKIVNGILLEDILKLGSKVRFLLKFNNVFIISVSKKNNIYF